MPNVVLQIAESSSLGNHLARAVLGSLSPAPPGLTERAAERLRLSNPIRLV